MAVLALATARCGGTHVGTSTPSAASIATAPISRPCTAAAARLAAPDGVAIGPIDDLDPRLPRAPTGARLVPASGSTPAYCLVTGSVSTNVVTAKTANFALALPLAWRGRLLFTGCAGLCGDVFATPPDDALARGWAVAATDDGHASRPPGFVLDGTWALGAGRDADEDAVADFFFRAVHEVTVAAKQLVRAWYSAAIARSYFFGCSEGGREGMVEAARHPEDFDGWVVGAPLSNVPGAVVAGRAARALLAAPDAYLPPSVLAWVDRVVLASCDELDGVKDGLVQNPARCDFDPRTLICRKGATEPCLTEAQAATLVAWLSAAEDEGRRVVGYGFSPSDMSNDRATGGNLFAWAESAGPPRDPGAREPWGPAKEKQPPAWLFYDQMLDYVVLRDARFDANARAPFRAGGVIEEVAAVLLETRTSAGRGDDPTKLAPFVASGRKLLLYHGFSDGFVSPFETTRFYEDWANLVGGYDELRRHARLFMVPGMFHCEGGPGPSSFDALGALERWVEHGEAPEAIVAAKHRPERTMPLCPFPTQARYGGAGRVNDAASWSCAPNEDLLEIGYDGALAGLRDPKRRIK